jgi:hypothetical protein
LSSVLYDLNLFLPHAQIIPMTATHLSANFLSLV